MARGRGGRLRRGGDRTSARELATSVLDADASTVYLRAADAALDGALRDGDIAAARAVMAGAHAASGATSPPPYDDSDTAWTTRSRTVRALAVRGLPRVPPPIGVNEVLEGFDMEDAEQLALPFAAGDGPLVAKASRQLDTDPRAWADRDDPFSWRAPRTSLVGVQRAVHAFCREPSRFGPEMTVGPDTLLTTGVEVTDAAFVAFVRHARAVGAHPRLAVYSTMHGLELCCRAEGSVRGRTILVGVRWAPAADGHALRSRSELLAHIAAQGLRWNEEIGVIPAGTWRDGIDRARSGETASTHPAPTALVGENRCAHPRAIWETAHSPLLQHPLTIGARLDCPDCLRTRAALVPEHRMPTLPRIADVEGYVRNWQIADIMAGRPVCESVEALRARDGVASLNPADHAIGERVVLAGVRTGGPEAIFAARRRVRS